MAPRRQPRVCSLVAKISLQSRVFVHRSADSTSDAPFSCNCVYSWNDLSACSVASGSFSAAACSAISTFCSLSSRLDTFFACFFSFFLLFPNFSFASSVLICLWTGIVFGLCWTSSWHRCSSFLTWWGLSPLHLASAPSRHQRPRAVQLGGEPF